MAEITAELVKKLRDATGISLIKIKNALVEADGDEAKAIEILRKSGEKDAAKKSDRTTSEGVVVAKTTNGGKKAAMVSILCETDFVARNPDFQALAEQIADIALAEGAEAAKQKGEELTQQAVTKIGEAIRMGDVHIEELEDGIIGSYIHGNKKIGVLVSLKTGEEEVARDLAMQVAALNPSVVHPHEVSDELVAQEAEIQREIIIKEGKPAEMAEKILEGKLKKFREEQALIKQSFVKDSSKTVEQHLAQAKAEIKRFLRLSI